jgi:acetoin utilization deacetylase AcuC-like enzyme
MDKLVEELEALSLKKSYRACYVYDEAMTRHTGDKHHPERPDRIKTINDHLVQSGLLNEALILPSRLATADEISLSHSRDLVDRVLGFTNDSHLIGGPEGDELVKQKQYMFPFDHDTYICHASPEAAQMACGSVLNVIDTVMSEESGCRRGFAAIRPPGHHACREKSMGFCLFNNVAVAAEYAKEKFNLKRIAIIDWDVHHGNGTSEIFQSRSDVLVLSIHRYDKGKFYPGTGHLDDIGSEQGKGFNINVPVDGSYGDEEMFYVWDNVVLPSITDFKPELILVSAGFDAAENDPLGQCRVSCRTYGLLLDRLFTILPNDHNRVVLVLEGGYNLKSIAAASVACMKSLLGCEIHTGLSSPSNSASEASSAASSVRSVPGGVPKTSVVKMVKKLSQILHEAPGVKIPITSTTIPQRRKSIAPKVVVESQDSFLLTSGGGHVGGVVRYSDRCIEKKTTVREALCYFLIAEACGESPDIELGNKSVDWNTLVKSEKKRVDYENVREGFKALKIFTCKCERIIIVSETEASVVLEDLTYGLEVDESLGVLDIKLGTQYHTPEDGPDRILTRRQKATMTSASSLGIRLTACKCLDGFTVGKQKAHKLKLMEQMVPLVRRFMYSNIENFEKSIATATDFSMKLLEAFREGQLMNLHFIASSVLFVIGTKAGEPHSVEMRCRMIDLAHLYPAENSDVGRGFVLGCENLVLLFQQASEPSYESA